jgi:nitroreductase
MYFKLNNDFVYLVDTKFKNKIKCTKDVLKIIFFCEKPRFKKELFELFGKKIVDSLIKNNIILRNEPFKDVKFWEFYNWKLPFFYYNASKNLRFKDENKSIALKELELAKIKNDISIYKKVNGETFELNVIKKESRNIHDLLTKRRTVRRFPKIANKEDLDIIIYEGLSELRNIRSFLNKNKDIPLAYSNSLFTAFEIYVINLKTSLPKGVLFYDVKENKYVLVNKKISEDRIISVLQGQKGLKTASFFIIISFKPLRFMNRYRHERAYRDLLMTSGELTQNLINVATAIGVKSFMTPALKELELESLLNLDVDEEVIYLSAYGK